MRRPPSLGSLLALLALVMQFGFGAALPRQEADAVLAASTLCHSDDGGPAPATPHTPDCARCPLCATVASIVFVGSMPGPAIPALRTVSAAPHRIQPHSPAPTPQARLAARPRAPPSQA